MADEGQGGVSEEDVLDLAGAEGTTKTAAREASPVGAPLDESGAPLELHPVAECFPPMSEEQYASFRADIAANGVREPIWIYEGRILDGRNRYRACRELGITPMVRIYTGDSPTAFAWSLNAERRHLSNAQRAALGVEMLPALQEEAKRRRLANLKRGLCIPVPPPVGERRKRQESVEAAAQIVGASATNIQYAKAVKERDPQVFEQLKRGELPVNRAYERVQHLPPSTGVVRLPREQRIAAIRRLAAEGHRVAQIAHAIGLSQRRTASIAHAAGIALVDAVIGKSPHLKTRRVIEETVTTLEGLALGLREIEGLSLEIAPHDAHEWAQSIESSLRLLSRLKKHLKRMARV